MGPMRRLESWSGVVPSGCLRLAATERATQAAGAALVVLALVEAIMRASLTVGSAQAALILCFLASATTLPLLLLSVLQAALAVTAASVVSLAFFDTLTLAGAVAVLATFYRLAEKPADGDRRLLRCVALMLPFLVLALAAPVPRHSEAAVLTVLLATCLPVAALVGAVRTARRQRLAYLARQQEISGALLEHSARSERARIARELHDVVAHHISMVTVQAETARLTTPGMPEEGARQLEAIGKTARTALAEMRQLLGVLRQDVDEHVRERAPQPTLAELADLLDQAREATSSGARLILRGQPVPVDPSVQLAVYRIAQEALTNIRRHADGAAVDVELIYDSPILRLRIRDNGPGPATSPTGPGHGLTGMNERAVAVGGRLSTGTSVGGGFLVEAILPVSSRQ
jgi:signal transduction histidine kinase